MTKRKASLSPSPTQETNTELALVPAAATTTSHPFRLPKGWKVEQVPRSSYPSQVDKYYHEPGTGRKFRSLISIERYIRGEAEVPYSRRKPVTSNYRRASHRMMMISNGRMVKFNQEILNQKEMALVPCDRSAINSPYGLPDGWAVEHAPRRDGRIDRALEESLRPRGRGLREAYYYEPGTGRKFRSQIAALRHLAEGDEERPLSGAFEVLEEDVPLSKMFKLDWHRKNPAPCKKKVRRYETYNSSFLKPPEKVNWVIASTQGDVWNPFIGETLIPDSVKNQWSKRFMLFMNDGDSEEEPGALEC